MRRFILIKLPRLLFLSMLFIAAASSLSSCSSVDEPETAIDYYLSIESRVPIKNTHDARANMMGQVSNNMREAIHDVYPIRDLDGNDAAVIQACDEAYSYYRSAYPAGQQNTECVLKLYRARMQGTIVKQSVAIKTYRM